jgi:two-component system phosphate regulon sensor histidine kinase PhoR
MVVKFFFPDQISWVLVFTIPSAALFISIFFINYYIESFVYRKIKLIYKIIYDTKLPEDKKPSKVKKDAIDKAESDVLEWKDSKAKELKKQKMNDQYRKEFVGNVFHELKTPIFNIQGYLETLIDGGIKDDKINIRFLKKASKNVGRMAEIVDDLQMISNLEDGSFAMNKEKFDIHKLVIDTLESMEIRAIKKGITLEIKEGCDKPFNVVADREMIQQVLNNLVTNSIKYGKENGRTQVGLYDMEKNILVEISDNGIGIDQQHLKHIFERFYRADKNRSRQIGGSGLGLSIVKHIIEAHNQTVNVRSTLNLGSTFGFTLKKA